MPKYIYICSLFLLISSNLAFSKMIDLDKIVPLAEKGIVKQQYNLGYSFFYGQGVEPDKEKAMYWLNRAAKGADAAVNYKIGRLYETGEIFPQNNVKAFQHYLKSAKAGDPYGAVNLSLMYIQGKGVKKSLKEGIQWAEKAANKGFVNAQVNLAILFSSKDKLVQDYEKSIYWFKKAASKGNSLALYEVGKYNLKIKNYNEAFEYFDLAVEAKNTNAMIMLAMMFEQGLAVDKSSEKSQKLLQLAYKLGNKNAAKYLQSYRTSTIE